MEKLFFLQTSLLPAIIHHCIEVTGVRSYYIRSNCLIHNCISENVLEKKFQYHLYMIEAVFSPHAVIMDCGLLENPENGQVEFTDTIEESVATYTCAEGYNLEGQSERTCMSDGEWSPSEPTCEGESTQYTIIMPTLYVIYYASGESNSSTFGGNRPVGTML